MKFPILKRRLPNRALAWLCVAALLASLLPLYALSFYNHACYDDFGFSIRTHEAWVNSGKVWDAVKAAIENTRIIRHTWEGTYATSFISALQPALFGENLYWITTVVLLTFFLASVWFFLKQVFLRILGTDRLTLWMAFCALAFVMIQFVPDLSEAFFWFNGGVAYTLMWSAMVLRLGVWVSFTQAQTPVRKALGGAALVLLSVALGGAKYSTVLLAVLIDALIVFYGFVKKRGDRFARAAVFALLTACFLFSAVAPGNGVRAETLMGGMSAPMAVLQAFYFGFALMGHWFSLPLLVAWALVAWQLSEALRGCAHRFNHPIWVTVIAVCLFCAQLAPTLYTGNYLGDGRTLNTYFYTFVLMSCALVLYWLGWFLQKNESRVFYAALTTTKKDGLRIAVIALAAVVLAVGCLAYRSPSSADYSLGNTAAGSALRSILSGEAARYDSAMDARDAALRDESQPEVVLSPVVGIPEAFMGDALDSEHIDYVLDLYRTYYNKQRVSVAQEGE